MRRGGFNATITDLAGEEFFSCIAIILFVDISVENLQKRSDFHCEVNQLQCYFLHSQKRSVACLFIVNCNACFVLCITGAN